MKNLNNFYAIADDSGNCINIATPNVYRYGHDYKGFKDILTFDTATAARLYIKDLKYKDKLTIVNFIKK